MFCNKRDATFIFVYMIIMCSFLIILALILIPPLGILRLIFWLKKKNSAASIRKWAFFHPFWYSFI